MGGDHQEDVDGEDPGGHVEDHGGEVESEDGQQDVHLDEDEDEIEMKVEMEMKVTEKMEMEMNVKTASRMFSVHQAEDQPDATPDYPRLHQTRSFLKKGIQINFDQSQDQDQGQDWESERTFLTPCMRSEATTISKVQRNTTIFPRMNIAGKLLQNLSFCQTLTINWLNNDWNQCNVSNEGDDGNVS